MAGIAVLLKGNPDTLSAIGNLQLAPKAQSMQVFIAGAGKLSTELLEKLLPNNGLTISSWPAQAGSNAKSIVVHAGSGREMDNITDFCARTSSVLVELATGSSLEGSQPQFPVVLCPNTNILMLKFMCMLERSGAMLKGSQIQITESHQASKKSVPGTAVQMANSLDVCSSEIASIRNAEIQASDLKIPIEHIDRHAFHRVTIQCES